MEADPTHSFNEKLSQWIASQGFWFQLRHSVSGGGGWSMTFFHLFRLGLRVLIVAAVAAVIAGIYLMKRTGGEAFVEKMEEEMARGLSAEEVTVLHFGRSRSEAAIKRLGVVGGDASFFHSLDAEHIRFRMGLFDGMAGRWQGGALKAKSLKVVLRAGADNPQQLESMGKAFHRDWPDFSFSAIDSERTDVSWGYSARTAGRIEGSHMEAIRTPGAWRLAFKGGTLSQNWLRKLAIEELIVECRPGRIVVTEGRLRCGSGTVVIESLAIHTGENPRVEGRMKWDQADLRNLLPESAQDYVEGRISGDVAIAGSTNSQEGVALDGRIVLDGRSMVVLRDELHLLKALSEVDVFRAYRKVEFDSGSFRLRSAAGELELSSVDMTAGELLTLQGGMKIRQPTPEETREAIGVNTAPDFGAVFDPAQGMPEGGKKSDDVARSMREAARVAAGKRGFETKGGGEQAVFDRMEQDQMREDLAKEARAREIRNLRYEGAFRVTLEGDAFDKAERLRSSYPKDPQTGRIPLDVPIRGTIYDLTLNQAGDLLRQKSQR